MLKLALNQPYSVKAAPVKIGSYHTGERQEFIVKFDLLIPADFKREDLMKNTLAEERELFNSIVTGWSGIADENGTPLPFNEQNKQAVLALDAFKLGLVKSLTSIALGQELEKN